MLPRGADGEQPDLQLLIGATVGDAAANNPATLAAERERAGLRNHADALCKDLGSELGVLHGEAQGLLEALQDDVATKMGSNCATQ